jgi:hypothetical protein
VTLANNHTTSIAPTRKRRRIITGILFFKREKIGNFFGRKKRSLEDTRTCVVPFLI